MKINGRGSMVMQQMMAMRASKQNAASSKAQNAPSSNNTKARNAGSGYDNDGDSDSGGGGGGETSAAQGGEQSGGINYTKLEAAVKAGVVKPAGAPRNREENNGNGSGDVNSRNVSTRQSEQAAKNGAASNVKQLTDAGTPQPSRSAGNAYTGSAKAESQQSSYAKGELVDLSA